MKILTEDRSHVWLPESNIHQQPIITTIDITESKIIINHSLITVIVS